MLFKEIMTIYCENHMKHKYIVWPKCGDFNILQMVHIRAIFFYLLG
jgi:hypothetical protein